MPKLAARGAPAPGPGPAAAAPAPAAAPGPHFGALPELPVVPTMTESIGLGMGQGFDPVNQANQQATIAQDQAATVQAQQSTKDLLAKRILPILRANPAVTNNPQFMQQIMKLMPPGVEVPRNPDGTVNANSLAAMISPTPTLTGAAEQTLYKRLSDEEGALSTGKKTPAEFLADVQSARAQLQTAGMSTAGVDVYLDPSGTQLNEGMVKDYLGAKTDADIGHLHDLGVHLTNEDALKAALIQAQTNRFNKTLDYKYDVLDEKRQHDVQLAQASAARIAVSQQNAATAIGRLQVMQQTLQNSVSGGQSRAYTAAYSAANNAFAHANTELQNDLTQINNMGQNAGDIAKGGKYYDAYQALTKQVTSLGDYINQQAPVLHQMQSPTDINAHLYGNISGNQAAPAPSKYGQPIAVDKSGRDVYKSGEKYVYADGSQYKPQ